MLSKIFGNRAMQVARTEDWRDLIDGKKRFAALGFTGARVLPGLPGPRPLSQCVDTWTKRVAVRHLSLASLSRSSSFDPL